MAEIAAIVTDDELRRHRVFACILCKRVANWRGVARVFRIQLEYRDNEAAGAARCPDQLVEARRYMCMCAMAVVAAACSAAAA
jgi:hypothetical protein